MTAATPHPRPTPDPTRCPLCGEPNVCGMASPGSDPAACWCRTVQVPPDLLASLPEAERRFACVCARCIARWPQRA